MPIVSSIFRSTWLTPSLAKPRCWDLDVSLADILKGGQECWCQKHRLKYTQNSRIAKLYVAYLHFIAKENIRKSSFAWASHQLHNKQNCQINGASSGTKLKRVAATRQTVRNKIARGSPCIILCWIYVHLWSSWQNISRFLLFSTLD